MLCPRAAATAANRSLVSESTFTVVSAIHRVCTHGYLCEYPLPDSGLWLRSVVDEVRREVAAYAPHARPVPVAAELQPVLVDLDLDHDLRLHRQEAHRVGAGQSADRARQLAHLP